MTCKECIHYEACDWFGHIYVEEMADDCLRFKPKSRFIELPCEVGQTVYIVMGDKRIEQPYEYKVIAIWWSADKDCNNAHIVRYVGGMFDSSISVPLSEFGRIIFLTKEEAEKALEERNKK